MTVALPADFSLTPRQTRWSDRLALDMALVLEGSGELLDELCERHHITVDELIQFKADPTFLKRVEDYRKDVRDKGMTFKLKARAQAEELLVTSWLLIHDREVSPAVKADLIKSTVKWAGLDAREEVDTAAPGGVRININFAGAAQPLTVSGGAPAATLEHDDG